MLVSTNIDGLALRAGKFNLLSTPLSNGFFVELKLEIEEYSPMVLPRVGYDIFQ